MIEGINVIQFLPLPTTSYHFVENFSILALKAAFFFPQLCELWQSMACGHQLFFSYF
jgi:hypothetical protein